MKKLTTTLAALTLSSAALGLEIGAVGSIAKAPVVNNGDVAGAPFDFVIQFDRSQDPVVGGYTLAAGHQIVIEFPDSIDLGGIDPSYPVLDVPTPGQCTPGNLVCSTAVLLKGWPQDPFFPPAAFHTNSVDMERNAFVITANQDITNTGIGSPAIKGVHLILNGLSNPKPGRYTLKVSIQTGADSWSTGAGTFKVVKDADPGLFPTTVFAEGLAAGICSGSNPPNPNTLFQYAAAGAPAPFAWSLLAWGDDGDVLDNLALVRETSARWGLYQGDTRVGTAKVKAPNGASGYDIVAPATTCPGAIPATPIIGGTPGVGPQPAGRLDLQFIAGDKPGAYITTISLDKGTSVRHVVVVE